MQSGADFMETHTEPSSKSNVQNAYNRAATECMVRRKATNRAPIPSGPRCYGAAVLSHNIYVMFNYYTQLLANYSFPFIMHLPFN
jgi:hypothetical protein